MTFGERLIELRIENGYSKRNEFADMLGIPGTTLRNYETNVREPGHKFLKHISKLFNVSVDYLLCLTDDREKTASYVLKSSEYEHIKKYRALDDHGREHVNIILDWETQRITAIKETQKEYASSALPAPTHIISYYQPLASAGTGEYLFPDIPTDTIEVITTPVSEQADFAIGVNGDSMEPTYFDGDKLFVKKAEEIPTGSIGIFVRDSECFIKELGGDRLISHNKAWPDVPASEDIRVVGLVLGKVEEA